MKINPIGDRVLIEPIEHAEKTKGGIFIPEVAKEKPKEGKIISIGSGESLSKINISVGDVVIYGKYSGIEIETEKQKTVLLVDAKDIFALITK